MIVQLLLSLFAIFFSGCGGDGDSASGQLTGGCSLYAIANGDKCGKERGPIAFLGIISPGQGYSGTCTGTFITPNKILTAAHCFQGAASARVLSGDYASEVVQVIKHPRWRNNINNKYDVAVVVVRDPIDVPPLPLLVSVFPGPGLLIRAMGYGLDETRDPGYNKDHEDRLKGALMVIASVDQNFFYSTFASSDAAICLGDSGGPAISWNASGVAGIIGVSHAIYAPSDSMGLPICDNEQVVSIFVPVADNEIINFILTHAPEAGIL
ncbi:MAG: S1 family peptidase [Deltaproteobacteria bacterium]|nr:S1 family peptidase [Deltaproteobacteria bacterium]